MKKITILALHLNYGGIERFITNLANSISDEYDVEIVSTYKLSDKPFFKLNDNIDVKYLITNLQPCRQLISKYLKKFKIVKFLKSLVNNVMVLYLKKHRMIDYIKKCDSNIIISTRDIHNKWLGKYAKKDILKIGSEHNDPDSIEYVKQISSTAKNLDYFVVVSNKMVKDYQRYLNIPVIYIPNSIDKMPSKISKLDSNNIISVGRLEKVKGFDDLIDVFTLVHSKNKDIVLNIIGDGSNYNILKNKIKQLHLENSIKLLGYKNTLELNDLYNSSSLYVMTSISESFGLVLLEAMSHKLPCIAFDSASGAKEIINDRIDGYLVDNRDKDKMADLIVELMEDRNRLNELGNNALFNSKKYLSKNIKKKWVDLFEK